MQLYQDIKVDPRFIGGQFPNAGGSDVVSVELIKMKQ